MIDIENFDNKFKSIVQSNDWKKLQDVFNKSNLPNLTVKNFCK